MIGHALKKTSERNTCNYRIENKTMPWGPNISSVQYCFYLKFMQQHSANYYFSDTLFHFLFRKSTFKEENKVNSNKELWKERNWIRNFIRPTVWAFKYIAGNHFHVIIIQNTTSQVAIHFSLILALNHIHTHKKVFSWKKNVYQIKIVKWKKMFAKLAAHLVGWSVKVGGTWEAKKVGSNR